MEKFEQKNNSYLKAKKRVTKEKIFYTHVTVYVIINIFIFIAILQLKEYIYEGYLVLNLISTPLLWGIALLIHGLATFRRRKKLGKLFNKLFPIEKWEQQKIKELMNEDDDL